MDRISSGPHVDHNPFQQRLELLGFKLEGIHPRKFVKGVDISDGLSIACIYSDYLLIKNLRGGNIWDSLEKMKKRIKVLPKESFHTKLTKYFDEQGMQYYKKIHNLWLYN